MNLELKEELYLFCEIMEDEYTINLSDTWFNLCLLRSIEWHSITILHFNSLIELQPVFILG